MYVGQLSLRIRADLADVGDDVETCILRLLQAADYDVARAE